jgi:hypothetical protein
VVLDDVIGSGGRAIKFVRWLYRSPTIKSWVSLRWVRFVIIAYACSSVGRAAVAREKLIGSGAIRINQALSYGRERWSRAEREAIEDLCDRYADRTRHPDWGLGYKSAFTCILLPHKCPNTNPAILWSDDGARWSGIFAERPEWVLQIDSDTARRSREDRLLRSLGVTVLADSLDKASLSRQSRLSLLLLACVAKRRRRPEILSEMLETPVPDVNAVVARCQSMGWLDGDARLTPLGSRALADARRLGGIPETGTKDNDGFYYPKSFRSPARSV